MNQSVLQGFQHKEKIWTDCYFGLTMDDDERSGHAKVIKIHPEWNMNVCTNVIAIHLMVVEIFQMGQSGGPTD